MTFSRCFGRDLIADAIFYDDSGIGKRESAKHLAQSPASKPFPFDKRSLSRPSLL